MWGRVSGKSWKKASGRDAEAAAALLVGRGAQCPLHFFRYPQIAPFLLLPPPHPILEDASPPLVAFSCSIESTFEKYLLNG